MQRSATRETNFEEREDSVDCCETDLDNINKNNKIVIFKINRMLRSHNTGYCFDEIISVELLIAPHRRPDSELYLQALRTCLEI